MPWPALRPRAMQPRALAVLFRPVPSPTSVRLRRADRPHRKPTSSTTASPSLPHLCPRQHPQLLEQLRVDAGHRGLAGAAAHIQGAGGGLTAACRVATRLPTAPSRQLHAYPLTGAFAAGRLTRSFSLNRLQPHTHTHAPCPLPPPPAPWVAVEARVVLPLAEGPLALPVQLDLVTSGSTFSCC